MNTFICSPTAELSESECVTGSSTGQCSTCNAEVWISPSTLSNMTFGEDPYEILCSNCFFVKLKNLKEEAVSFGILPEAATELERHLKYLKNRG